MYLDVQLTKILNYLIFLLILMNMENTVEIINLNIFLEIIYTYEKRLRPLNNQNSTG